MKNDHDRKTCWHCVRGHQFMTAKCASDFTGKPLKAIYNNEGRHFHLIKDGGVYLLRVQVEAHVRILLEKGRCKGECSAVLEQQAI